MFVAPVLCWRNCHLLHRRVPRLRGDDGPAIRSHADQRRFRPTLVLSNELADVEPSSLFHIRRPSVADVRVVCPDNSFGIRAVMTLEALERLDHVSVPDVPRISVASSHLSVVLFGVFRDECVLFGVEIVVSTVVVRRGSRLKLRQRIDDLVLAGLGDHPERLGVLLGVLAVRFETPVRLPRFGCGVRVHVLEIVDDRFQRDSNRL